MKDKGSVMKNTKRVIRKRRVKERLQKASAFPRLSVRTTLSHTYAQIIDDASGKTLCSASDLKIKEKMTKAEKAVKVGEMIAENAKKVKINKVVFDRGARLYHGRVKNVADSARKKGLEI